MKKDFDIKELYTPLSVAKKEIWKRWNDKELRKKVQAFLGADMPEVFKKEPKATIVRYIITPNYEFFYFLNLAELAELDYACLEYSKDKFVAKNPDKYNLCKLFFFNGTGKKGGHKVDSINAVNFNKTEGKILNEIKTEWGEKLIDFHHAILKKSAGDSYKKICDFSDWFDKSRNRNKNYYYLYYLALFICNGILFENFLLNKNEEKFTKNKVIPSFIKLKEMFGVYPLIVPLEPPTEETDCTWRHYSKDTRKIFDKEILIKNKK
jgi:hypothetical protein